MSSTGKLYSTSIWLGFLLLGSFIQNANSFSRGRDSPFPASATDTGEKESSSSEESEVIQPVSSSHNTKEESSSISFSSGNKLNKTHSSQLINSVHEDQQLKEILCPGTSLLYRYDLRAGKCAQTETQSHCGQNMIFTEEAESSSYGYCECDFESHNVPLVFHLQTNQCYPVYRQAYCRPGEWLVISPEAKGPICQRNHCLGGSKSRSPASSSSGSGRRSKLLFPGTWNTAENDSGRDHPVKLRSFAIKAGDKSELSTSKLFVPLNGTGPCVALGQPSKYCRPEETVIISPGKYAPRCQVPGLEIGRGLTIIPNPCPPGSYYSIIGYCQPVWDF